MQKQVDKSHYNFASYMDKRRWTSIWHQLNEVIAQRPTSVLEVGPGSGTFKNAAASFGFNVKTLDIDPELNPDYVGSATAIPVEDHSVDVACAFQVLEHMPFEVSMQALKELCRVARRAVVISLPDVKTSWATTLSIPKLGTIRFVLPRPGFKPQAHQFDGEHYWEISKQGYSLERVICEFGEVAPEYKLRTYRVHENQYHRFFILEKRQGL
jgi:ubiquinone/menaquinone biosynthesis C-methylase UbiE